MEKSKKDGILALTSGFLCMFVRLNLIPFIIKTQCLGVSYLTGNLNPYITDYYRQYDKSISDSTVYLMSPVASIATTIFAPIGGFLAKKYSPRVIIAIGLLIGTIGFIAASFQRQIWAFILFYSYISIFNQAWLYFPKNKGLAGGISFIGVGMGPLIFGLLSDVVINPNDLGMDIHTNLYPRSVLDNLMTFVRIIGLFWFLVLGLAIIILQPHPDTLNPNALGSPKSEGKSLVTVRVYDPMRISSMTIDSDNEDVQERHKLKMGYNDNIQDGYLETRESIEIANEIKTKKQKSALSVALQSRQFFIGNFLASQYKTYGLSVGLPNRYLTLLGSIAFIFGAIRFIWSYSVDRFSFKFSYTIVLLIQIVISLSFRFVKDSKALYFIWICAIIFTEAGHFAMFPTAVAKLFGDLAPQVYGIQFTAFGLSSVVSTIIVYFTLDSIGHEFYFNVGAATSAFSLLILLVFFKETKVRY
ncbi:UNKNOWN [Stylonychia lemnae]|uniref:Major facilitator superfamily protein n=1 Tax=Stylonychia lemnae TaxID=5949 RepID=A0A078AUM4_STYLE|nr:UNKNOWN [Stylonychia lemnae]|eukprot:CDW84583.1 UNKNOWN [Stylonychia lemnae]